MFFFVHTVYVRHTILSGGLTCHAMNHALYSHVHHPPPPFPEVRSKPRPFPCDPQIEVPVKAEKEKQDAEVRTLVAESEAVEEYAAQLASSSAAVVPECEERYQVGGRKLSA